MARKKTETRVVIDQSFTYHLDASRTRTLPVAWRGPVPDDIARMIVETGNGRIADVADEPLAALSDTAETGSADDAGAAASDPDAD